MIQSMKAARTQAAHSTDLLGETLYQLKLSGVVYCRAELTAPWGINIPAIDAHMSFQVVTSGHAWLEVDGNEPLRLQAGSLTLLPHGTPHRFRSALDAASSNLQDIAVERISDRYETMHFGGGGSMTQIMHGLVRLDNAVGNRLLAQLPTVLHFNSWDDDDSSWLHGTLRMLAREASALCPGGETVITRLADILVIQALRSWLLKAPEAQEGWLAALRDPQIGMALQAIHSSPANQWTVAALAGKAGMSRSAFSTRFTDLVGESAMRYLSQWRMNLARTHILQSSDNLALVANRVGYQSEAAFSRAFKRFFGVPPASVRST